MRAAVSRSLKWRRGVLMQETPVWWRGVKENFNRKRTLTARLFCLKKKERIKRKGESRWFKGDGEAAKWRRESETGSGHAFSRLRCLSRVDYKSWDVPLFRINPPGNYRWNQQQPSAGAWSSCNSSALLQAKLPHQRLWFICVRS